MIYVDDMLMEASVPNGDRTVRGRWSHLMADTDEELIAFGRQLRLARSWLQYPGTWKTHFDVVASKRAQAIRLGAIPVKCGQMTRTSNNEPWRDRTMPKFTQWPALIEHLTENGGRLVVSYTPGDEDRAVAGYEFGREAEDSDMAGGAAYGMAATLDEALIQMAEQVGIVQ
jgi:hypothetical protein